MRVGVVTGLAREEGCLKGLPKAGESFVSFSGSGPERAKAGAQALITAGAGALMSFGVAGGLSSDAVAGAVVLGTEVVFGDQRLIASKTWRRSIREATAVGLNVLEGSVAGCDEVVPTAAEKGALHKRTGALVCDMESHAVARVAAGAGVPLMIVRAVSDAHDREVPRWVLNSIRHDGSVRVGPMLGNLACQPWALPRLLTLARETSSALDALGRVARLLGPGLGLP